MGLKEAGAKLLLKGGLLGRQTMYIGLMTNRDLELNPSGIHNYVRSKVMKWDPHANLTGWSLSSGGAQVITNHRFPTSTTDWGVVTHFGLWDSITGGNLLVSLELDVGVTVTTGTLTGFDSGNISFTRAGGTTGIFATLFSSESTDSGHEAGLSVGLFSVDRYISMHSSSLPTHLNRVGNFILLPAAVMLPVSGNDAAVVNSTSVSFGSYTRDLPAVPSVGIWDGNSTASDSPPNLLWSVQITAHDPRPGERLVMPAGELFVSCLTDVILGNAL